MVLNADSDVTIDVKIFKISRVTLVRIEYFSPLLFHQLKISKSITLFHWRIISSIWISLLSTQPSDIGSDTNRVLLLSYSYPHLTFEDGYGYEYWRMWKNIICIRIGGRFGCRYPQIICIRWHTYICYFISFHFTV